MPYITQDEQGISNPKVYRKIARFLKKGFFASKKIEKKQAESLQVLTIYEDTIVDLEFLRSFPRLKNLNVASANLTDISGLRHVANLEELCICNHALTDISPVTYCRDLAFLEIETYMGGEKAKPSQITDFSVVSTLKNLIEISFEDNNIRDISWVRELLKLEHLLVSKNPIEDFSPARELPNLKWIEVSIAQKELLGTDWPGVRIDYDEDE